MVIRMRQEFSDTDRNNIATVNDDRPTKRLETRQTIAATIEALIDAWLQDMAYDATTLREEDA